MAVMSRETFEEWRKGDDQFKVDAREFFGEQRSFNLDIAQRVTAVETKSKGSLAWLGALAAAIVGAVKGYFGRA